MSSVHSLLWMSCPYVVSSGDGCFSQQNLPTKQASRKKHLTHLLTGIPPKTYVQEVPRGLSNWKIRNHLQRSSQLKYLYIFVTSQCKSSFQEVRNSQNSRSMFGLCIGPLPCMADIQGCRNHVRNLLEMVTFLTVQKRAVLSNQY